MVHQITRITGLPVRVLRVDIVPSLSPEAPIREVVKKAKNIMVTVKIVLPRTTCHPLTLGLR